MDGGFVSCRTLLDWRGSAGLHPRDVPLEAFRQMDVLSRRSRLFLCSLETLLPRGEVRIRLAGLGPGTEKRVCQPAGFLCCWSTHFRVDHGFGSCSHGARSLVQLMGWGVQDATLLRLHLSHLTLRAQQNLVSVHHLRL